jgi:RNA-directed DNA polymerase
LITKNIERESRTYQLYDKVYRADVLLSAWVLAKANNSAPDVDGESFGDIDASRQRDRP